MGKRHISYDKVVEALDDLPVALRTARRMRDVSLREVARQTGVSFTVIGRVERGEDCMFSSAVALLRWLADVPQQPTQDPLGIIPDKQYRAMADDLRGMARQRRQAENEAGQVLLP